MVVVRAYALGAGAGTQAFINLPWMLLVGEPQGIVRVLLMTAGWGINLAIAEWLIRSRPKGNTRPAPAAEYLPCP